MRLLVLASRPSDYSEMAALARALADRGHQAHLIYFYAPHDPGSHDIISSLESFSSATGLSGQAVDVDQVQLAQVPGIAGDDAIAAQPSQAAEIGLYNIVLALRDRVLGRDRAIALGRRLPTLRRIFPVIYKVARLVDVIRNLPQGLRLAWTAATLPGRVNVSLPMRARMFLSGPKVMADGAYMEAVYRRFHAFFLGTLSSGGYDALLIPEDIVGNLWPVAIKASHELGIPTLVLPYTLANREEALQSLRGQAAYQTSRNQIAAALYPSWRAHERESDLVRLPSAHILAHERLGITPPDPWMMNSGYADKILVDSQASFDYFLAGGIPGDQLEIVGSPSQDEMFARRQNRSEAVDALRLSLGLAGNKPLLLVSGCPNQLAATVPFCEFSSIGDVARHVGDSLAPLAEHYHLIVRPHPNFPEFGGLLQPFGFVSTMAPTASLVPLAEVFVAFASATIRWAIACGIPTVNYDVFHYGYADFDAAHGVRSVKSSRDFRRLVRSLTPGSPVWAELEAKAREDSARWSLMDGHSALRIEQAISTARRRRAAVTEQPKHA